MRAKGTRGPPSFVSSYRTFKLGSLPTAALDNILDANVGRAQLLLGFGRRTAGSAIATAVAIETIAARIGMRMIRRPPMISGRLGPPMLLARADRISPSAVAMDRRETASP